jgi:acetyl-CoA C-acetyltransferase
MGEVVITSAVRTAIGNFLGALSPFSATELGGKVIEEAVKRSKIQKKDVDELVQHLFIRRIFNITPVGSRRIDPALGDIRPLLASKGPYF